MQRLTKKQWGIGSPADILPPAAEAKRELLLVHCPVSIPSWIHWGCPAEVPMTLGTLETALYWVRPLVHIAVYCPHWLVVAFQSFRQESFSALPEEAKSWIQDFSMQSESLLSYSPWFSAVSIAAGAWKRTNVHLQWCGWRGGHNKYWQHCNATEAAPPPCHQTHTGWQEQHSSISSVLLSPPGMAPVQGGGATYTAHWCAINSTVIPLQLCRCCCLFPGHCGGSWLWLLYEMKNIRVLISLL